MFPKSNISATLIAAFISTPVLPHPPAAVFGYQASAHSQAARQTKVNQLLAQNPEQSRIKQARVRLTPSWQLGTVTLYTLGSDQGGHSLPVRAIAFSPDGHFLAVAVLTKRSKFGILELRL